MRNVLYSFFIVADAPFHALNHTLEVNISHRTLSLEGSGEGEGVCVCDEVMEKVSVVLPQSGLWCEADARHPSCWYCYSALQHCSNRMDLSLHLCVCCCEETKWEREKRELKSQPVRTAATCSTNIEITSMFQQSSDAPQKVFHSFVSAWRRDEVACCHWWASATFHFI